VQQLGNGLSRVLTQAMQEPKSTRPCFAVARFWLFLSSLSLKKFIAVQVVQALLHEAHLVDIDCGDGLGVGEDLLVGVAGEELDALVPLVGVVRVLAKHDTGQQLRPPLHQMLQPRQPGAHMGHDHILHPLNG
jgi:hypothetical protein